MDGREGRPLYLDAQATTSMDPRVLDAMLPYMTGWSAYYRLINLLKNSYSIFIYGFVALYGNPHSRTHAYGWESETAVEAAREVCKNLMINSFN